MCTYVLVDLVFYVFFDTRPLVSQTVEQRPFKSISQVWLVLRQARTIDSDISLIRTLIFPG